MDIATFLQQNKTKNQLVETKDRIKNELHKTLITTDYEYGDLISLANSEINKDYSVEVVAPNGRIIAWNNIIAIKQEEIFPFVYPLNEVHFFNSPLITYLNIIDTVNSIIINKGSISNIYGVFRYITYCFCRSVSTPAPYYYHSFS